jgi:hypothetical protein
MDTNNNYVNRKLKKGVVIPSAYAFKICLGFFFLLSNCKSNTPLTNEPLKIIVGGSPHLYLSNNLPVYKNDNQVSNTGSCKCVVLLVTNKTLLPNVIFYLHGLLCLVLVMYD